MSICFLPENQNSPTIKLSQGSGGQEMQRLITEITSNFPKSKKWKNTNSDGATFQLNSNYNVGATSTCLSGRQASHLLKKNLVFTSDSFVVSPIFFPGGNIGKLAFCGTVNDLVVMGADPIGLSLSLILEEGFSKTKLLEITNTIAQLSQDNNIPIVTGDTKVMPAGSIDQIVINTSGVGLTDIVLDKKVEEGDKIIVSGGIGEHGAALLTQRFDMESDLITDSKALWPELKAIRKLIKQAKDITRGGLAAILNELADSNQFQIFIDDTKVPVNPQVKSLTEILGLDYYQLACEGRFVCIASITNAPKVLKILQKFNSTASIIGQIKKGKNVIVQTNFGSKILHTPTGNIVPRIC